MDGCGGVREAEVRPGSMHGPTEKCILILRGTRSHWSGLKEGGDSIVCEFDKRTLAGLGAGSTGIREGGGRAASPPGRSCTDPGERW